MVVRVCRVHAALLAAALLLAVTGPAAGQEESPPPAAPVTDSAGVGSPAPPGRARDSAPAQVAPADTTPADTTGADPIPDADSKVDAALRPLGFMAGCWRGSFDSSRGAGTIEERYSPPAGGLMLGNTRYVIDGGAAIQFEFHRIWADSTGAVHLLPYPGGTASEHAFRLTSASELGAVFEAPEHDFPKRIVYRRDGERLTARVDGGEGTDGAEWSLRRVDCP